MGDVTIPSIDIIIILIFILEEKNYFKLIILVLA